MVEDSLIERALKEMETKRQDAIHNRLTRSKVFCKVLLWLVNNFRKSGVAHPKELATYLRSSVAWARALLTEFEDLGLITRRRIGIIVEYIPIYNNEHMVIDEFSETALRVCGIHPKNARLDDFKARRGMK